MQGRAAGNDFALKRRHAARGRRKIKRGVERRAADRGLGESLQRHGFKPGDGTLEPMARQIESDMRLFTTVIRERNLKFDS